MKYYQQPAMVPSVSPESGVEELIDLKAILQIVWRSRWIIALCTILMMLIGGTYAVVTPSVYTATSNLLIDPRQVDPLTPGDPRNYSDVLVVDSQIEVLRSRRLAVLAMYNLKLFDSPPPVADAGLFGVIRDWLLGGLAVDGGSGTQTGQPADAATPDASASEPQAGSGPLDAAALARSQVSVPGSTPPTDAQAGGTTRTVSLSSAASVDPYDVVDSMLETTDVSRAKQIDAFAKSIEVERVNQTYVIAIHFTDLDRRFAARAADAVATAYLQDQLRAQYEAAQRSREWVDNQLEILRTRLFDTEKEVENYKTQHNLLDAGSGTPLIGGELQELTDKLIQASSDTADARARMERLDQIIDSDDPESVIPDALASPIIRRLREQYTDTSQRASEIRGRFGENHQIYRNALAELARIRSEMADEMLRIAQSYRNEYEIASKQEDLLRQQLAGKQAENAELAQAAIGLRELEREATSARTAYQALLDGSNQLTRTENLPRTDARILERAGIPEIASAPKRKRALAIATVFGLMMGFGVVLLREMLDDRIWTQGMLERVVGRRSIGVVPDVTLPMPKKRRRMPFLNAGKASTAASRAVSEAVLQPYRQLLVDPYAPQVEVMRAVNLTLTMSQNDEKVRELIGGRKRARVVSFVSCRAGEGKTTMSAMFANYIARGKQRVLVVDADYRRPTLTRRLLPDVRKGIFDLYHEWNTQRRTEAEAASANGEPVEAQPATGPDRRRLDEIIHASADGYFAVLPGRVAQPRDDLIVEEVLPAMINDILDRYGHVFDVIVIDFPPVLILPDAATIAGSLDAMFLVTEWGKTDKETVRVTLNLAKPVWSKIAGCILNKAKIKQLERYGVNESLRVGYYG